MVVVGGGGGDGGGGGWAGVEDYPIITFLYPTRPSIVLQVMKTFIKCGVIDKNARLS